MLSDLEKQKLKLKLRFIPDVAEFEPIPLPNTDGQTNTRKVIKAKFINPNPRNPDAPLEITVCHQRKTSDGVFEDCESFSLSKLKAGEEIRMILDTEQTLAIKTILDGLFNYCRENLGVRMDPVPVFSLEKASEIVKVEPDRKALIQKLVDGNYEEEFWDELEKINPDGATKLSYSRIFSIRNEALKEFKKHMDNNDWTEPEWQDFFEKNTWIFGYGLTFKWIEKIGSKLEQTTEGNSVDGKGKKPDGFMKILATLSTTLFIDIKTPGAPLLKSSSYRPGVFPSSDDVVGGISQIQMTIEKWVQNKHMEFRNTDDEGFTDNEPVFSFHPKGILVVGSLGQFKKDEKYDRAKMGSFELFRRQLNNPEIITFDELYNRAEKIISNQEIEKPKSE